MRGINQAVISRGGKREIINWVRPFTPATNSEPSCDAVGRTRSRALFPSEPPRGRSRGSWVTVVVINAVFLYDVFFFL